MSERDDTPVLPEVSDAVIDRIEDSVFSHIATQRRVAATAARRRRRRTVTWVSAAACLAVVTAIAVPALMLSGANAPTADGAGASAPLAGDAKDMSAERSTVDGAATDQMSTADMPAAAGGYAAGAAAAAEPAIITIADASVTVDDITAATTELTALARKLGGSVEAQQIGTNDAADPARPAPSSDYGYVTLRVPSARVTDALDALDDIGTVTATSVNRTDVTATKIDLEARVGALETSVERLQEIMAKTGSVADLVAAEGALSERQATLESYRQQLDQLTDQVTLSTLSVSLSATERANADPAGFTDGISTGWNGLVATLNALIVAVGFLLPWLAVAAAAALIVWLVARAVRGRRRRGRDAQTDTIL